MSKCPKVKNPCKICLGPVTQKNGLQCHGICESWVHYGCLHYTPGRIRDIKQGIINVTCPCPDCKTQQPKEYRTDDKGFSCGNQSCPANQPPRCEAESCPINLQYPSSQELEPNLKPNNFKKCGADCEKISKTQIIPARVNQVTQGNQVMQGNQPMQGNQATQGSGPCHTGPDPGNVCRLPPIPPDALMAYYRNANSSTSPAGQGSPNMSPEGSNPALGALEQMCNTVGQLAQQLNDLMCVMKEGSNQNGTQGCQPGNKRTCNQTGPRAKCPKPCRCPGNPGKRR